MNTLPKLIPLSNKEVAIMHIMKANPESVIESLYIDEYLNCYCKFEGCSIVHDFTTEMRFSVLF